MLLFRLSKAEKQRLSVQAACHGPYLCLIVRQWPLVDVVIMTGAKEEVKWHKRKREKVHKKAAMRNKKLKLFNFN